MAFAYTTYINTTPERLWQALTDPEFTRQYWGVTFVSEWTAGATMTWEENGVTISDPEQVVLEAEPGRRPLEGDLRDRAGGADGQAHRRAR